MKPTDLTDHPEGGRFREVFRSGRIVTVQGNVNRSALTHIYFSLNPGEVSLFHRVTSDEVWNLYEGEGVRLYSWDGTNNTPECIILSSAAQEYCHVIEACKWQAAEPVSGKVLVGCSVAPGFEFDDFAIMKSGSEEAKQLLSVAPEMKKYVSHKAAKLTK